MGKVPTYIDYFAEQVDLERLRGTWLGDDEATAAEVMSKYAPLEITADALRQHQHITTDQLKAECDATLRKVFAGVDPHPLTPPHRPNDLRAHLNDAESYVNPHIHEPAQNPTQKINKLSHKSIDEHVTGKALHKLSHSTECNLEKGESFREVAPFGPADLPGLHVCGDHQKIPLNTDLQGLQNPNNFNNLGAGDMSLIDRLQATQASLTAQYANCVMQLRRLEQQEREILGALQLLGAQIKEEQEGSDSPDGNTAE